MFDKNSVPVSEELNQSWRVLSREVEKLEAIHGEKVVKAFLDLLVASRPKDAGTALKLALQKASSLDAETLPGRPSAKAPQSVAPRRESVDPFSERDDNDPFSGGNRLRFD